MRVGRGTLRVNARFAMYSQIFLLTTLVWHCDVWKEIASVPGVRDMTSILFG